MFHSVPLAHRAFVLGNVIMNPMADLDWRCATYESVARRRRDPLCALETVHIGKHEEAHTWQYQVLGPFFPPGLRAHHAAVVADAVRARSG